MWIEFEISDENYQMLEKYYNGNHGPEVIKSIQENVIFPIVKRQQHYSKKERNKLIFELRNKGKTYGQIASKFDISIARAQQVYENELYKRIAYDIKYGKNTTTRSYLECILESARLLSIDSITATKAFKCLSRAKIMQTIETGEKTLADYSDHELLSIRQFGPTMLHICRLADKLYKEALEKNQ